MWHSNVSVQISSQNMLRVHNLSRDKRSQAVILYQAGCLQCDIGTMLGCSQKAVFNAIHRYQETGDYFDSQARGCHHSTSEREGRYLRHLAIRKSISNALQLQSEW